MTRAIDLETLAKRVALLEAEKEHLVGKFLGLHTTVLALLLGRESSTENVIGHLAQAIEANQATGLQTSLSDVAIGELDAIVRHAQELAQQVVASRGRH